MPRRGRALRSLPKCLDALLVGRGHQIESHRASSWAEVPTCRDGHLASPKCRLNALRHLRYLFDCDLYPLDCCLFYLSVLYRLYTPYPSHYLVSFVFRNCRAVANLRLRGVFSSYCYASPHSTAVLARCCCANHHLHVALATYNLENYCEELCSQELRLHYQVPAANIERLRDLSLPRWQLTRRREIFSRCSPLNCLPTRRLSK